MQNDKKGCFPYFGKMLENNLREIENRPKTEFGKNEECNNVGKNYYLR